MTENLNPIYNVYSNFRSLIQSIVIKYNFIAESNETIDTKKNADGYLEAVNKLDTFETYRDYTTDEYISAGVKDPVSILQSQNGNHKFLSSEVKEVMLNNRRTNIINSYEEQNDYYRMLNGLPSITENPYNYHYIPSIIAARYDIDKTIPIHKIQDYYNNITYGDGDYYISVIEGLGIIDELISQYPNDEYLNYIGSKRIDIALARQAKNFSILRIDQGEAKSGLYESFITLYSQSRDYFASVVYNPSMRDFIDYYDNFIAMCIMIMTINQTIARQMKDAINYEFYDSYGLKLLYEAYNVPYNMNIDDDTQRSIAQHLNLLIQNKSTNKVIYDITELLGFSNVDVYKYYLMKQRNFDLYGVPVVEYKDQFNNDTGEIETVYDYQKMFDVYFEKVDLKESDIVKAFNSNINREEYDKVVTDDPFWWEDQKLTEAVWNTEYNYVESKYLGLTVSYKLTDILYENIMLLKMLMDEKTPLSSIKFSIPKIMSSSYKITLFDAVILLVCLTAKKHKLGGEIISVPSQVISVLDYLRNIDTGCNKSYDSFAFDFSIFTGDIESEYQKYLDEHDLTTHDYSLAKFIKEVDKGDISISLDSTDMIKKLVDLLDEDDSAKLLNYLSVLKINNDASNAEKITAFNSMYSNIKNLANFINFKLSETNDKETYDALKQFYRTVFYAKENKSLFSIINAETTCYYDSTGGYYIKNKGADVYSYFNSDKKPTGKRITEEEFKSLSLTEGTVMISRVAKSYFEFLYWYNPKLYNSLFTINLDGQYHEYCKDHEINEKNYSITDFENDVYLGLVDIEYDTMLESNGTTRISEDLIYYFINHIISRMEEMIKDIRFLYLLNDMATPLEELLMKMIRFFKSYTVDLVDMNIIYIYDLKAENILKFFDKVHYILKNIETHDYMRLPYSDTVHGMEITEWMKDKLTFSDSLELRIVLTLYEWLSKRFKFIDELKSMNKEDLVKDYMNFTYDVVHGINTNYILSDHHAIKLHDDAFVIARMTFSKYIEWAYNHVILTDKIESINKLLSIYDTSGSLYDSVLIKSSITHKEKVHMKDRIMKIWYSED